MKTIILPGYSSSNKEWADEIKNKLDLGHEVLVHEWKHWLPARRASGSERTEGSFSLKLESEVILKEIGRDKVNIIAKSVGTRVMMYLIQKVPNFLKMIQKMILCGIPTGFESAASRKLYKEGLTAVSPTKILVIQNTKDPLANFSVVNKFVKSVNPKITVIGKDRSDHHYPYSKDFKEFLRSNI